MRKFLAALIPTVLALATIAGIVELLRPKISAAVLRKIQYFTQSNLPVQINAQDFQFQFFLPKIKLLGAKITAANPEELGFDEITVESIEAQLDLLQILAGKISISKLNVVRAETHLTADSWISKEPAQDLPIASLFKILRQVPVGEIVVSESKLTLNWEAENFLAAVENLNSRILIRKDRLSLELLGPQVKVLWNDLDLNLDFSLDSMLTPRALDISLFEIKSHDQKVQIKATFSQLEKLLKNPLGTIKFSLQSDLLSLRNTLASQLKLPLTSGEVKAQGVFQFKRDANFESHYQIDAKDIKIKNFDIGSFRTSGQLKDRVIFMDELNLWHDWGQISSREIKIKIPTDQQNDNWMLEGSVRSDLLDLHDFLLKIGVGDIPVELLLGGGFKCLGPIYPSLELKCNGEIEGELLEVRVGDGPKGVLIAIPSLAASGGVTITKTDVSYQANLKVAQYSGSSSGKIGFFEGFQIQYLTPEIDFSLIQPLVGLGVEGQGSLSGETKGDSSAATFFIQMDGKNTSFENYFLGDFKGRLSYEKSILKIDEIRGQLPYSQYLGQLRVNLADKTLDVNINSPNLNLLDANKIFSKVFPLPFEVASAGEVKAHIYGPLILNQLSYQATGRLKQLSWFNENFERLQFSVHSDHGEFVADEVNLYKRNSQINLSGKGHPDGQVEFLVKGSNLLLEESENISKLGPNISGKLNFTTLITQNIFHPDIDFKLGISNVIVEDQEFAASTLGFKISKTGVDGNANLLGNRLTGNFNLPFDPNGPFSLKAQARDWNFTTALLLIGGASLMSEYESSISGNIELNAEKGGIFASTGFGEIKNLTLRRDDLSIQNRGPMEAHFKNGEMSLKNFALSGEKTKISVEGEKVSRNNLNLVINGATDLRLFQIFFPFFEELAGTGKIKANIGGKLSLPEVLGQASVEDGYFRLKAFPHAFEKLNGSAVFSQSKILISRVTGNLGGGILTAEGQIKIEGLQNFPTQIRAHLQETTLNVPEGVLSSGDAEVQITGNWFPMTMSGTYRVKNGTMTKEFTEEALGTGVKQSSYLPKMILRTAFEPLLLDLNLILEKPITIKNSMVEGLLSGELQIKGPPGEPKLVGKITLDKNGKLMFRDKVFDVNSANVTFVESENIDPELFITARSRVSDYDINLLVQGTAKAPQIRLTSSPPLSEQDIISLLALGMTSSKIEKTIGKDVQDKNTATQIGNAILANSPLSKNLQQNFGIEFQITSSYDDTKNVAVRKFIGKKKVTKKIEVSVSQSEGGQKATEGKVQYSFNPNVSAIATWENRDSPESRDATQIQKPTESIFGLDLEFKREFK